MNNLTTELMRSLRLLVASRIIDAQRSEMVLMSYLNREDLDWPAHWYSVIRASMDELQVSMLQVNK